MICCWVRSWWAYHHHQVKANKLAATLIKQHMRNSSSKLKQLLADLHHSSSLCPSPTTAVAQASTFSSFLSPVSVSGDLRHGTHTFTFTPLTPCTSLTAGASLLLATCHICHSHLTPTVSHVEKNTSWSTNNRCPRNVLQFIPKQRLKFPSLNFPLLTWLQSIQSSAWLLVTLNYTVDDLWPFQMPSAAQLRCVCVCRFVSRDNTGEKNIIDDKVISVVPKVVNQKKEKGKIIPSCQKLLKLGRPRIVLLSVWTLLSSPPVLTASVH